MPVPRPSSDNYGSPSDAGIMDEDYQHDQSRFKEVSDKELEAFQNVVTDIANGKELAEQQKLGRIYTVLEDTLVVAKMACPDELRLDIEATEQALYDVGQMIKIVDTSDDRGDNRDLREGVPVFSCA